jgi:hypothetical protein
VASNQVVNGKEIVKDAKTAGVQAKTKVNRDIAPGSPGIGFGRVNYDHLQSYDDEASSDENLALQLFEGEEMNADMANFIGIHMLNEIIDPEPRAEPENDFNQIQPKEQLAQYIDP